MSESKTTESGTTLTQEQIEQATAFHGHWCPGLAIGLRAAELALREVGSAADEEVVAVTETDMCGVDAIQFLTKCTFGKGNLLHRDHGKMAFSFYRRSDGKGLRLILKPDAVRLDAPEYEALRQKRMAGTLSTAEQEILRGFREERSRFIMNAALEELFDVQEPASPMPAKARNLASIRCAACGESTMETRIRRFGGQELCIPCFETRERRF